MMKKRFYDFLKEKGYEFCYRDDKEGFLVLCFGIDEDHVLEFLNHVDKEHKREIMRQKKIIDKCALKISYWKNKAKGLGFDLAEEY